MALLFYCVGHTRLHTGSPCPLTFSFNSSSPELLWSKLPSSYVWSIQETIFCSVSLVDRKWLSLHLFLSVYKIHLLATTVGSSAWESSSSPYVCKCAIPTAYRELKKNDFNNVCSRETACTCFQFLVFSSEVKNILEQLVWDTVFLKGKSFSQRGRYLYIQIRLLKQWGILWRFSFYFWVGKVFCDSG